MKRSPISLRGLDVLRGALAVYVVLGHSRWLLWAGHAEWLRQPHVAWEVPLAYASASLQFGREAVMVFFALSGFFIHLRAAEQFSQAGTAHLSGSRFYQRRLHRLAAPYLLALIVTVACDFVGRIWFPRLYESATGDVLLDAIFARAGYVWQSVVPASVLLPSSLGRDFGSNGPLWSLGYEVVYYALYPAWLAVRTRRGAVAFALVPLVCLILPFVYDQYVPSSMWLYFPINVLAYYPVWLAGAALAERLVVTPLSARTMAIATLVFCGGMTLHLLSHHSMLGDVVAAVLFGTAAVCAFAALPGWLCRSKVVTAVEYLGVRSYTLYIVHFPFLVLMGAWVLQTRGTRPLHGWLALVGAALTIAFGCLCFAVCERHFLHARLRMETSAH